MQERNWGDFSEKTWPEIQKVLDKMTLNDRYNFLPPNGESWKEFDTRLKTKLNNLLGRNSGKTIVVVTHGGAIRALIPHLLGVPKEESFKYDGANFTKVSINDNSHLNN
ncbi:hypothetical protein A3A76_01910 [Candidatus Woesebacteria bacterium RIFCSPLOWO2_01_FULL_39_23]|uniref:Phosphoglycerate mutase n=1 Tax=Candidatus Woesebacteria bacterium RIFCSPHIGHO2_01_FULL_40_22 TaxID=1802499 RepID=A0A1F7YGG5_9BACT|nr:MAG: hypothetical protein A2141_05240 [Candidatus Woesebacteria bacterium RBG_16_40_11]OGM26352.1 MAG: hypothetical protein A2628_03255 [Candidatus Woesebacteria bacterium RIFCSPHIGHO2_01_FULL_40_22]OGM61895.1 MAG: hypothetical protein A3A76_01910 [Candidatus Woesebacteria bacterium RIFCSPLOWO2_01_FULL_39_23]